MFLYGLVFVINLLLLLKVCALDDSTMSIRSEKCKAYKVQVYGQSTPPCPTSNDFTQPIAIDQFPHVAILEYYNVNGEKSQYRWSCHGSIVSSRYVLTIAHCFLNTSSELLKVRLGAINANSNVYDIESTILHPLYNPRTIYKHIGLIKLARKVEFSENVRPICLPDSDVSSSILYQVNYEASINNPLKIYENVFVTKEECNKNYAIVPLRRLPNGITDDLLCLRKTSNDSDLYESIGDSGAPIYIDQLQAPCSHVQVGIVCFGVPNHVDVPDIAINVYHFADWIASIIWADGEDI